MSASTKLSTSVKALCYMAHAPEMPRTSSDIAEKIGVNASKLRKLLSMMVKSGIVESAKGTKGGFVLRKSIDEIDLQEVYCAIEDRKAFHLDVRHVDDENLSDSAKINNYFLELFSDIQVDIENKMRKLSLRTVIENALKNDPQYNLK